MKTYDKDMDEELAVAVLKSLFLTVKEVIFWAINNVLKKMNNWYDCM